MGKRAAQGGPATNSAKAFKESRPWASETHETAKTLAYQLETHQAIIKKNL